MRDHSSETAGEAAALTGFGGAKVREFLIVIILRLSTFTPMCCGSGADRRLDKGLCRVPTKTPFENGLHCVAAIGVPAGLSDAINSRKCLKVKSNGTARGSRAERARLG